MWLNTIRESLIYLDVVFTKFDVFGRIDAICVMEAKLQLM